MDITKVTELFSNVYLYVAYTILLVATAIWLLVVRYFSTGTTKSGNVSVKAEVKRGPGSMAIIHGTFVVISGLNIGLSQVVIPFLTSGIIHFAFAILLVQIAAWAFIIYGSGRARNWLIGLVSKAGNER